MANTSTDTLTETMYASMEKLQQEDIGFLNSVQRNQSNVTTASFGTPMESIVTGDVTITKASSYTPQMQSTDAPDDADTKDTFALDTHLKFEVALLPEQMRHANNVGIGAETQLGKRIAKGLRGMRNQLESDLAAAMYTGASRAVGTAGTTPFASNLNVLNEAMKIIQDNGGDRYDGRSSAVFNSSAGLNIRNLLGIQDARQPKDDDIFSRGVLMNAGGFNLRESAGISLHTKGTGSGYLVDLVAGYSVGDTTIHVDTGTGTILAGDVITFAGDANEYVVVSGFAGDGDGDITIGGPGLQAALTNNTAVTVENTYTPNLCFHEDAAEMASRSPDLGEDKATLHSTITDDVAGITYAYSIYPGEGMQKLRVQSFVGYKVWNQYLIAALKG